MSASLLPQTGLCPGSSNASLSYQYPQPTSLMLISLDLPGTTSSHLSGFTCSSSTSARPILWSPTLTLDQLKGSKLILTFKLPFY